MCTTMSLPIIFLLISFAFSPVGHAAASASAEEELATLKQELREVLQQLGEMRRQHAAEIEALNEKVAELEKKEDAIGTLERLVEMAPDHFDAKKELATLYIQTGQQDKAREMMDEMAAMGEADPNILYNLGAERFNEGDHQAAADYFIGSCRLRF